MEDPQTAVNVPVVSFKKRSIKAKSNIRKREATPPPASDSDSGFTSSEDEEGRTIKRRRKNAGVTASSASTRPTALPETASPTATAAVPISTNKDDATKASNWYDEDTTTKPPHRQSAPSSKELELSDGTYRGVSSYQSFLPKNPDRQTSKLTSVGPVKSSSNVRTITVTDFAPDVCKDYKQTGFCGFGDSCKFLHAREDYKQGWQLDRDWEINTKGKAQGGKVVGSANRNTATGEGGEEDEDKMLESIPFKCIICKEDYKSPIVTKCGHYFLRGMCVEKV